MSAVTSSTKFVHDDQNVPLRVAESILNEKTLTHSPSFPFTAHALGSLKSYKANEEDIWLISYPKSRTHWTFEILGILLSGTLVPLEFYKHVAFLEAKKDIKDIPTLCGRRIYNTHLKIEYLPEDVLNKCKVIYVARNPMSVAVSFFKQATSMKSYQYSGTFTGFYPLYLQGLYNIWDTWFDHVPQYWKRGKDNNIMKFLFYEELTKNPGGQIYQLSQWLGLSHTKEYCEQVAKLASLENMKKATGKTDEQKKLYSQLWKEKEHGFFRNGKIDGWKETFTVAQNEDFDQIYNDKMKEYPDLKKRIQFS